MDRYSFEHLQKQIETTLIWLEEHEALCHWTLQDIEDVLQYIQAQNTCTLENLRAFHQIQDVLRKCLPSLKTREDLLFLCEYLNAKTNYSTASQIQGVLIGKRSEITALRKVCFLTDAHARSFPGLSMHSGIYDETYLADLSVPSLATRLKKQRDQLFTCLSLPKPHQPGWQYASFVPGPGAYSLGPGAGSEPVVRPPGCRLAQPRR